MSSIKKGEVWKISSRGFNGVVKILEDIENVKEGDFFEAEIVEGVKHYMSRNRYQETTGDQLSFRTTLTEFIEKRSA